MVIIGIYYITRADPVISASPTPGSTPDGVSSHSPETEEFITSEDLVDEERPAFAKAQFKTDFSKYSVSYTEILSDGPPKDGLHAVDRPV